MTTLNKSFLDFIKIWSILLGASFIGKWIVAVINKQNIDWNQFLYYLVLWFFVLISYFIGYIMAYKTKLFSSINNRKRILIPITFIFSFIFIIIFILL